MSPIRVLVVDDAPLIRDALAAFLIAEGMDVVGTAPDPAAALSAIVELEPDVVLLDVRMPPTYTDEGIEVAVEVRRRRPGTGIVLITQDANGDPLGTLLARLSGDSLRLGFIRKEEASSRDRLCQVIAEVAAGAIRIDPTLAADAVRAHGLVRGLTSREHQVLVLMASGLSNRGIADELVLSIRTVEGTIARIFERLGLTDSSEEIVNRRVAAVVAYLAVEG